MNTKILAFALLLTMPMFAQAETESQLLGRVQTEALDMCVVTAVNYAIFVLIAQNSTDEQEFKTFIEAQINNQSNPAATGPTIRKFAEEAWAERNSPPTKAALDIFHQCEQSVIEQAPSHRPKDTTT